MNDKSELQDLHFELYRILYDFINLCDKYNLQYFLVEGSLLGAARHKGIIPWDDDIDVAMPRNDYNRLKDAIREYGENKYLLYNIEEENKCLIMFSKFIRKDSPKKLSKYYSHPSGLSIDVFPLDYCLKRNNPIQKFDEIRIRFIRKVVSSKITYKKVGIVESLLKHVVRKCSAFVFSRVKTDTLIKRIVTISSRHKEDDLPNIVMYGSIYPTYKENFPKEYWYPPQKIRFGDQCCFVPNEYKKILQSVYGNDYMRIPNEEKRYQHIR